MMDELMDGRKRRKQTETKYEKCVQGRRGETEGREESVDGE